MWVHGAPTVPLIRVGRQDHTLDVSSEAGEDCKWRAWEILALCSGGPPLPLQAGPETPGESAPCSGSLKLTFDFGSTMTPSSSGSWGGLAGGGGLLGD